MNKSEYITQFKNDFFYLLPETITCFGIILILLVGIISQRNHFIVHSIAFAIILLTTVFEIEQLSLNKKIFEGILFLNFQNVSFKLLVSLCMFLSWLMLHGTINEEFKYKHQLEIWLCILTVNLGAKVAIISTNFLVVFLGLEIVAVGSYVLLGLLVNKLNLESATKYILFGMFSAGMLIYGMTMLYGITGEIDFSSPLFYTHLQTANKMLLAVGVCTLLCGLFFKIAVFPFHFWSPDVYEGSPPIVLFLISSIPKIVGFAVMLKVSMMLILMNGSNYLFYFAIALAAIVSTLVGNFGAFFQLQFKRLMGYSSIAQSGFVLLLFLNPDFVDHFYIFYYLVVLVISNYLVFYIGQIIFGKEEVEWKISDLKGLGWQSPWIGISMLFVMVSFVGLPPTPGFLAKLFVFSSLWELVSLEYGSFYLVVFMVAILTTLVALYIYLKIIYAMYFHTTLKPIDFKTSLTQKIVLSGGLIMLVGLFFGFESFSSYFYLNF